MRGTPRLAATLIELIVVLAVIGILTALFLPAVQSIRTTAMRTSCQNRMRQIGLALHAHHDAYGAFPVGVDDNFGDGGRTLRALTWLAQILPYVEQEPLWRASWRALALDPKPWDNPPHVGLATVIPVYTCPADGRMSTPHVDGPATWPVGNPPGLLAAFTSYLGVDSSDNDRNDGVLLYGNAVRIADITDGTSNTVAVGERPPSAMLNSGWWYTSHWSAYSHDVLLSAQMWPDNVCVGVGYRGQFVFGPGRFDNQCDMYHFWSPHPGGANFAFADGSVRFLRYSAAPILPALASRNGGEVVELP